MKLLVISLEVVWILLLLAVDISAIRRIRESNSVELNLKTYPAERIIQRNGEDLVINCRDEGPIRSAVSWKREDGKPIKSGSKSNKGRLEILDLSKTDAGSYVCQATEYLKYPGSEKTVEIIVEENVIGACSSDSAEQPVATCRDGKCINKSSMCDGILDCSDGLDEFNCGESSCEPIQFQCTNTKCVLKTWYCDGEDDCGDNSDEENCSESVAPPGECLSNEFKCEIGKQCVPMSFYCDGMSDCLDNSDELHCEPTRIIRPPTPKLVRVKPGQAFTLECKAIGEPLPIISWRLNTGSIPENCATISEEGAGVLTCQNVQPEHSGAYSCEAYNSKDIIFASPDAVVYVNDSSVCLDGYFNSEARSSQVCERCFCFGQSTQCRSADLFEYKMATPLGEIGAKLISVKLSDDDKIEIEPTQHILRKYHRHRRIHSKLLYRYSALENGAMVSKKTLTLRSFFPNEDKLFPYLSLPDDYIGNQLTSYGGFIQYKIVAHSSENSGDDDDNLPYIIIMGKYMTLVHLHKEKVSNETSLDLYARLTPEHWMQATASGFAPVTREDIMMTLNDIDLILLRATMNGEGVNITDFAMSSAGQINTGEGTANLVEECTCPPGYEGLSCQDCASGFIHSQGPWLGKCVPELQPCEPGTYRREGNLTCIPCPCPFRSLQNFATNCSIGPKDIVTCDCKTGYEGEICEKCVHGYEGNPLALGGSCKPEGTKIPELTNSTESTDVIVRLIGSPLINKEMGESVNLTCEAHDINSYSRSFPVEWRKMDGDFPPDRYQFNNRTGVLFITDLQLSDSGDYICKTRAGDAGEAIANLKVHQGNTDLQNSTENSQEVVVVINPPIKIVEGGSNVNFTCQAFNQKTFTRLPVMWTKAAGQLPQGRSWIDWQTGSLLINDVQVSDNGTYTCRAHDEDVMENADLKVLIPPGDRNGLTKSLPKASIVVKITSSPSLIKHVGEDMNFTCEAHSWTAINLRPFSFRRLPMTWIKVGCELPQGRHQIDEKNGRLLLTNLRFSDSGLYACIASDGINIAQDLATLQVDEDIEIRN